ncbi:glutamine-synthetase adenylyltransferase [Thioclava sp. GXIMD4216]|uniref:[protein-PII] uridylyltransferase family protein n=1 Tax=Thioclava sp. GXIMD4216 TaxID=3131929 RepID=UPI0030CC5AEE
MSFASRLSRLPIVVDQERADTVVALYSGQPPEVLALIEGVAGTSPFLATLLEREKGWIAPYLCDNPEEAITAEFARLPEVAPPDMAVELRRAKRRVALVIALADLGGIWGLEEVTRTLSAFADLAVDLALKSLLSEEIRRGKIPGIGAETLARACGIVALAMGKMGAGELNYSSDIDLICLFDQTQFDPDDLLEIRAGFVRVTRKMAQMLSDITSEGYVFRTDLRLRPDAGATPVCLSMASAELYYAAEGRTWERAAHIKARPSAGDLEAGAAYLDRLSPFVWRRHLDFATIQDTHDMRTKIRDHKGLNGPLKIEGHNLKLGAGGIREIEFFTQTRQLIAGGRDPDLRDPTTVGGLAALAQKGWIPREVAAKLTAHYRAHREIEHRLQMVNDSQTQTLPNAPEGIARIAAMMGESDPDRWMAELKDRLEEVEALTSDFFAPTQDAAPRPALSERAAALVARWTSYPCLRSSRARLIFARLEPDILRKLQRAADFEEALQQFDRFLHGLPAGVQLFSLFEANPQLVDLLVDICGTSPMLANYLSQNPGVLDAVIGGSFFESWPGIATLETELDQILAQASDYENALDQTRRWAKEWRFHVGVHHLRGLIDATEAAKYFADIAGVALERLWPVVCTEFAGKYGPQPGRGACVMAMGSFGSERLTAASDLDLIVIYDAQGVEMSDGPKPLASRQYFARLTQALITAVSAQMPQGRLYEVDMRLRPSGRSGPVATSLDAFRSYQMTEAWVWEHLALTRARPIAGDPSLAADLEYQRREILRARGGDARVLPDLAEMRARIFATKPVETPWEAKVGPGRLQDIELLAQSLALRAGSAARRVEQQLRAGGRAGLIPHAQEERLASIYRFLWRLQSVNRLLSENGMDIATLGEGGRSFLLRETDQPDVKTLQARIAQLTEEAAAMINQIVDP